MPTNYTLILPLQSSGKMEVTPMQSEILQKELFKMGYRWTTSGDQFVKYTEHPFIAWYSDKELAFSVTAYKYELVRFNNHFKIEE